MFNTFKEAVDFYKVGGDTPVTHTTIYKEFSHNMNDDEFFRNHRNFIEVNRFGYGERPFHWMWNLLIQELPNNFKFLEIGVYQGQIVSLMSYLNKKYNKGGEIVGVTPLTNVDDKYSKHPNLNYEERIATLYNTFNIDMSDLIIATGLSNDPQIISKIESNYKDGFDCVYIDGGHDYETVISDINVYAPMVKIGGYLIMDDSACKFNIPDGLVTMNWKGLPDVCRAVEEKLENDDRFEHIFSVAHIRIWKRII